MLASEGSPVPTWAAIDWEPFLHDRQINGRRVRYVDYGTGPVIVLVHGLGGAWQNWLENLPVLGADFRLIAIDLPGFGASEALAEPGDIGVYVETITALADELKLDPFVLVGHSMGGLVVSLFAIDHSEYLTGLVLVCAGGIALGRWRLGAIVLGFTAFSWCLRRPGWSMSVARRPLLRRWLFGPALGRPDALSAALAVQIIPPMGEAPGFRDGLMAGARAANASQPEAITAPVLLIWGVSDPILPVAKAREMATQMPNAQLVELPSVGHCPMFEAPHEFNHALASFCRHLAPPHVST